MVSSEKEQYSLKRLASTGFLFTIFFCSIVDKLSLENDHDKVDFFENILTKYKN